METVQFYVYVFESESKSILSYIFGIIFVVNNVISFLCLFGSLPKAVLSFIGARCMLDVSRMTH